MSIEINVGDGSITSRREAWRHQSRSIKAAFRLIRNARQRGILCLSAIASKTDDVTLVFPTRCVYFYHDGVMIQGIISPKGYHNDPQWKPAMHRRQHARYFSMAQWCRTPANKRSARFWIEHAAMERINA